MWSGETEWGNFENCQEKKDSKFQMIYVKL